MKINNKLVVAVSSISSVAIIGIVIIKKLISKYKVINQLNQLTYDFIDIRDDIRDDMLEVVRMMKEFINKKEEENKDDTGNC